MGRSSTFCVLTLKTLQLYLWGVLGFPPPTFRGRVEGTNLYWAPGMECRREPWCVTKIVKTTLQVLKPSKLSVATLKTIEVNFARLGWRDAPGGAPKAHSILGPRGGNSEKISEVTFSSFFFLRCTAKCRISVTGIDLTHALISSLPALNRGLHQAVTSARGVLTRCKKAVLGITLRLAGSQSCTISHRRIAEAH